MRIFCLVAMVIPQLTSNYAMILATTPAPDGAAAFADRKAQALFHGDRVDQLRP